MGRIRRGTLVVALLVPFVLGAVLATALGSARGGPHELVVPSAWRAAWDAAHVREGGHVALAWGDRAGEDPRTAAADVAFDPAAALTRLEALHALQVDDLGLGVRDGPLAERKLLVVVDGTWTDAPAGTDDARPVPATGDGTTADVVDGVGVLRVTPAVLAAGAPARAVAAGDAAPTADASAGPPVGDGTTPDDPAAPPADAGAAAAVGTSWELARGFAEVTLRLTTAGRGDDAPDGPAAASFRAASAAYLATLAVPSGHADVTELLRAPHLAWGSARHGAAGWLLLDSLVARADPGLVADLWTRARDGETALAAYARLTAASPEALNRRVAQYAMRAATGDAAGGAALLDGVDPVLLADRTTPTEVAPDDPAHHRVTGAFAPAAYGFTVVRLVPDGSGGVVRVRVRGHAEADASGDARWSVGMVAVGADGVRYGPVTETVDGEVTLAPRAGDETVLLVVTATPASVPGRAVAAFGDTTRYPYEFRVAGATVADPAAVALPAGGHRHANGGGWVDDRADVAATAYVGPQAVVRGAARVRGDARLEGRAWVEDGAVVEGGAVVRDAAVVRSGAHLSGTVVVGGDAVVDAACADGVHTAYRPDGSCAPGAAATDVNAPVTPFAPDAVALAPVPVDEATAPAPTPGTPAPEAGAGAGGATSPPAGGTGGAAGGGAPTRTPAPPPVGASPPPSPGVVAPPPAVPAGACTARYELVNSWPNGYQAQVTVTATTSGVQGWLVQWSAVPGLGINDRWGADIATSGGTVSAENLSWNGAVADGQSVVFGFTGTAEGEAADTLPQLRCTQTR